MAFVSGVESRSISIDIDKLQALKALAQELNVYCYFEDIHGQYYKIKNNKMYSYEDVSHHGSPIYEESLISENELLINNYKLICELAKVNKINLKY